MTYATDDTIAALASAPGGAARAIVRLAGPDVAACLGECFAADATERPLSEVTSATVLAGQVRLDSIAAPLPCQLYYWPDARSYTRSPMAELHTIGSPPLADALLRTICASGARLAEPGEFTLRAFLGGRLDLMQAEAVLGVIDAQADQQLNVALAQLAGGLSRPLTTLRDTLLELLAHLEAGLDFVEEDIEFISREQLLAQVDEGARQIQQLADQMASRTEAASAVRVVLVGPPNAGKSSLFNALAEAEHAIVSQMAGTTRDYLTADIELTGLRCQLVDTAGVEEIEPKDQVASAAQQATRDQQTAAQIRLLCFDVTESLTDEDRLRLADADADATIIVWTKCDVGVVTSERPKLDLADTLANVRTSSTSGAGLDELRQAIAEKVNAGAGDAEVVATTAIRCRDSLHRAAAALVAARELADARAGEELVAIELRTALDELGHVTGAVYTDDILDRIFSRFCIGK